jgi:hypothetical protein
MKSAWAVVLLLSGFDLYASEGPFSLCGAYSVIGHIRHNKNKRALIVFPGTQSETTFAIKNSEDSIVIAHTNYRVMAKGILGKKPILKRGEIELNHIELAPAPKLLETPKDLVKLIRARTCK